MRHLVASFIRIKTILKDKSGATMVEYALMVTFIAVAAFASVQTFGTSLNALFATFPGLFP